MSRITVLHEAGHDDYFNEVKEAHKARVDKGEAATIGISIRAFSDTGDRPNQHNQGLSEAIEHADRFLISRICVGSATGSAAVKAAEAAGVFKCEYGGVEAIQK